ncbi:hypothetical protein [Streptomyces lydicus]|uniref:hypothetical protein n=2 Tax=Streptomyces lydicus TaxID=47763 RepID=UPI0010135C31|nr:hypothetical protein [Streptomyces lydicus]UEG89191.1 hypothetical protein LJ741_00710 [Streptomyces lydicus]
MSRTELERLARIRMQVTGETLERAMAVLAGHPTTPDSEPEPETAPPAGLGADADEQGEQPDGADTSETTPEGGPAPGTGRSAGPDTGHPPRRRSHLRGL